MEKINVITLCSGYDSQCMALYRIKKDFGLDYDLIAWSEIDKYACQAHDAVFPQFKGRNLGDMTTIDWSQIKEKIDLLVYSTPCQSISSAGLQHGFKEGSGTRSSIIWSTLNAIDVLKPKYLLLENVKAMVSKKFLPDFKSWLDALEERGYKNYWQVLNAKDYGVPQNRERVFVVSVLGDEKYQFPEPFELKLRLKDILESNVDEKYYLSKNLISYISKDGGEKDSFSGGIGIQNGEHPARSITANYWKTPRQGTYISILGNINPSGNGMNGNAFDSEGVCPTLATNKGEGPKIKEPLSCAMRGRNPVNPSDRAPGIQTEQRIEVGGSVANCITTVQKDSMILEPNVLTPKRTEYGKKVRKAYENGEIQESRHNMTEMQPREDGISNTITTVQKDNLLVIPKTIKGISVHPNSRKLEFKGDGSIKEISPTIRATDYKCPNCVWEEEPKIVTYTRDHKGKVTNRRLVDIANTIHTSTGSGGNTDSFVAEPGKETQPYRIRKLTERECFRLMGVTDADIDKIQSAGISRTQQYKMAGNSIVVDVLYHIFRKMFIDKTTIQLTLF